MNRREAPGFPLLVVESLGMLVNMAQMLSARGSDNMNGATFEVRFRGKNHHEAQNDEAPSFHGELRGWKPSDNTRFDVDEVKARARYNMLVKDGIEGRKVDGIVPHVVEIVAIKRSKKGDGATIETMLWQYAEREAVPHGPWSELLAVDDPVEDDDLSPSGGSVDAMAN